MVLWLRYFHTLLHTFPPSPIARLRMTCRGPFGIFRFLGLERSRRSATLPLCSEVLAFTLGVALRTTRLTFGFSPVAGVMCHPPLFSSIYLFFPFSIFPRLKFTSPIKTTKAYSGKTPHVIAHSAAKRKRKLKTSSTKLSTECLFYLTNWGVLTGRTRRVAVAVNGSSGQ